MEIREGEGWRLQVDPGRHPHCALIGGLDWAVELQAHELGGLRRGVLTLLAQRDHLLDCLMPEEELELDLDLSLPTSDAGNRVDTALFVSLSGTPTIWSLRFVLTPGDGSRAVEGGWSTAASPALAAALEGLGDGCDPTG